MTLEESYAFMEWLLRRLSGQTSEMYRGMVCSLIRKGADRDLEAALAQFSPASRNHRRNAWRHYGHYKEEQHPPSKGESAECCTAPGCYRRDLTASALCEAHLVHSYRASTSRFGLPNFATLLDDGSARLRLTNRDGEEISSFLVSGEDLPRVQMHRWSISFRGQKKRPYIITQANSKGVTQGASRQTLLLHRFLTDAPKGMQVDHINGDPYDNRRSNLRVLTKAQQMQNTAVREDNPTGYRNVRLASNGKYLVTVSKNKRRHHRGPFETIEEAVAAAQALRKELHPYANEAREGNGERASWAEDPFDMWTKRPRKPHRGKPVEYEGKTYISLAQLVREKGNASYDVVVGRLRRGSSLEEALSLQPGKK